MLNEATINKFNENFRGELIQPTDSNFDEVRKVYNGMIDRHPAMIAKCADVADVITAVNFGRENNMLISIIIPIYNEKETVLEIIETVENVGRILHDGFLSPDNRFFYLASQTDDWMAVIDVENWEVVERIETGDTPHPGSGAIWEADGRTYGATVHAGEGLITVWDLATNEIVGNARKDS